MYHSDNLLSSTIIMLILMILFIFFEFLLFNTTEYEYRRVDMVKLTNKFTQDSVEVRHIVVSDDDGTLRVINNVPKDIKAGDRVIVEYDKSWLLGVERLQGHMIVQ